MAPAMRGQQGNEQTSAMEVPCSFPESTAPQLVDIDELEELQELGPRVRALPFTPDSGDRGASKDPGRPC